MSTPKIKTIKRLFAVSGNKCAFPNCKHRLIDENTGKVIGEICHIKAQNPKGPRFDPDLSDNEINDFTNLVLLCPLHHSIVDSDLDSYTVERLQNMKSSHETIYDTGTLDLEDNMANQFIENTTITNTIVFESNQLKQINPKGGQYAQTIQNFNSPIKYMDNESYHDLLTRIYDQTVPLSQLLAETIKIAKNKNEPHLIELCTNELSGWEKEELPDYRMVKVYISTLQIKSANFDTPEDLWFELESNDNFVEKTIFFPITVPILEISVKQGKHHDPYKSYIHLTQKQGSMFPQLPNPEITVHIYARGSLYYGLLESVRNNLANEILKRI